MVVSNGLWYTAGHVAVVLVNLDAQNVASAVPVLGKPMALTQTFPS